MPRIPAELGETHELESPPVKVATGLGTYAGLAGVAAAALPLALDALTDERLDARTRVALIVAGAVVLIAVILSRGAQAVAAELSRGRQARPPAPVIPFEEWNRSTSAAGHAPAPRIGAER